MTHDVIGAGLRAGDIGAVVQLYQDDSFEVEFVTAIGETRALVLLRPDDVRAVTESDLLAVRPAPRDPSS